MTLSTLKCRYVLATFCLVLLGVSFASARQKPIQTDLSLVTMGHGHTKVVF